MELCLISCNIRFDNPADGQHSWQYRRDFLAQTLLDTNPTIIATQEGRFHQLNELKTLLKDFDLIDQHRSWIGERMYPTIFIRRDIFEFLGSGDSWLSETPEVAGSLSFGSTFPRLMTWAKLQLRNSEQKLLIINTHLDHIKPETRLGQIKVLIQEVKRLMDPTYNLIFMGDFNEGPEGAVRAELMKEIPKLRDSWKLFNTTEETSHHAFKGEMQNGSRIDWILVDEKIEVTSSKMEKCVKDGIYPTDHFPIISKIKL